MPLALSQVDSETALNGFSYTFQSASVVIGGVTYLVVPNGYTGLTVYSVAADGQMTNVFVLPESSAQVGDPYGVAIKEIGGQVYVYVASWDDGLTVLTMASDGSLTEVQTAGPTGIADLAIFDSGGTTYIVTQGDGFICLYSVDGSGLPTLLDSEADSGATAILGYGEPRVVEIAGVPYIVVHGSGEGSTVYTVVAGSLVALDTDVGNIGAYGLATATVGGTVYVVEPDPSTGMVAVSTLAAGGTLTEIGAYAGPVGMSPATMAETFVVGGVTYVAVGGSASFIVYSLDAAGVLTEVQTVSTSGDPILDFHFLTVGGNPFLIANGASATLSFSLGAGSIDGTAGGDTLIGTPGDDVMNGLGGNDLVKSLGGHDTINGGDGNDDLRGAAGDDVINGDADNDVIDGGDGDDLLDGGSGDDVVNGGNGDDLIDGGTGTDTLAGGAGDDDYLINDGDTVVEAGGRGHDTVFASIDYTLTANVEDLIMETGATSGTGNALDNFIDGNDDDNLIAGLAGDDELHGHGGDDEIDGGSGNDLILGHDGDDELWGGAGNDFLDPGDGDDIVHGGSGNDLMGDGIGESLLYGDAGDDEMHTATDGLEDWFFGGDGSDIIYSNDDQDRLVGGLGDDFFFVDGNGPTIIEAVGEGDDTVISLDDYTLDANVENLILVGGPSHGIGNALNNAMEGSSGNDVLEGLGGNDTLYGVGRDRLIGGEGDDDYYLAQSGGYTPTVVEGSNGGTDTVRVNFSYRLLTNFENLWLYDSAYEGIGNAVANIITGSEAGNRLVGLAGDDTLRGMGGSDLLEGGAGNDNLNGGDGDDSLDGGAGDDVLDGGSGLDTLNGGAGNDTYKNIDADDTIVEADARGIDTVQALINYTLGANLEHLNLLGAAVIGIGNALDNTIKGNGQDNELQGLGGDDTLYGLDGEDLLLGGIGNDALWGGNDADELRGEDGADVLHGQDGDDLVIGGLGADELNGDNGDDILWGEDGGDTLKGGNGADEIHAGLGNDFLTGGAGADRFIWVTADLGAKLSTDRITDLTFADGDVIDLSGIDANSLVGGDQAFSFVAAFTKAAGQAVVAYSTSTRITTISFDINGDGKADFKLELSGDHRGSTGNLYTGGGDTDGGWIL